jgi:Flp pilus assembly pilin Flp
MLMANEWISRAVAGLMRARCSARGERGQDLIEYSMLGGLLAGAIILVAFLVLTGAVESLFTGIGNCLDWDGGSDCLP